MPVITGECSICTDNFEESKAAISATPCGHIFHANCLNAWTRNRGDRRDNTSCPECRFEFPRRNVVAKLYFNSDESKSPNRYNGMQRLERIIKEKDMKIDRLLAEKLSLTDKIYTAGISRYQSEETMRTVQAELHELQSSNEETIRSLTEECNRLNSLLTTQQNRGKTSGYSGAVGARCGYDDQVKSLQMECSRLRSANDQALRQADREVADLEKDLCSANQSRSDLRENNTKLKEEISRLKYELENYYYNY